MRNTFLKEINNINCYSSALVYVAKQEHLNLNAVLKSLFCETDFYFDSYNKVFTSKSLIKNLKNVGLNINLEFYKFNKKEFDINNIQPNSWFILGVDCYNLPWHAHYKKWHATHYFPVFKIDNKTYLANEPIYGKSNIALDPSVILNHAIEVEPILITKNIKNNNYGLQFLKSDLEKLNIQEKIVNNKLLNFSNLTNKAKFKLTKYVSEISSNKYLTYNLLLNNSSNTNVLQNYENNIAKNWLNIKFGVAKLFFSPQVDLSLINDLINLTTTTINEEKSILLSINSF